MWQKIVLYLSSILLISIFISACGKEHKYSKDRSFNIDLQLKKIDHFTIGDSTITLDRVRDIPVVSPDESMMAWVNSDKNEIIITDNRGKIISIFGKKGRGSGEFSNISAIGFEDSQTLYIYDWSQDFFKKFSIDGELL